MKNLFLLNALFLAASSTFAIQTEYLEFDDVSNKLPREIRAKSTNQNLDGTTTIFKPRLVRGNRSYPFASSNDRTSICKAMGFKKYLKDASKIVRDENAQRAYINSNGTYNYIKDAEYYSVEFITCYNENYKPHTQLDDYLENSDGTVTIFNPKLVRGHQSFNFHDESSKQGTCKVMGFDKYLPQSYFQSSKSTKTRVFINSEGNYYRSHDSFYYSIEEITCYKEGHHTTVVIDKNGKKYFRNNKLSSSKR